MSQLNSADYLILFVLGFATLGGFLKGFLREVLSLLTWVIASVVSGLFSGKLAAMFGGAGSTSGTNFLSGAGGDATAMAGQSVSVASVGVSFICIFIGTFVLTSLVTKVITYAMDAGGVGLFNRMLGALFGAAKGSLVVVVMIFVVQMTSMAQTPAWTSSQMVQAFQPGVKMLDDMVKPRIQDFRSKAEGLTHAVSDQIKNVGSTFTGGGQ